MQVVGIDHVQLDARVPGVRRAYTADPFGNRIELIQESNALWHRTS